MSDEMSSSRITQDRSVIDAVGATREALRAAAKAATAIAPGAWEHDTEQSEGAYGAGPDARHGFSTYLMMDEKGRRLFDAHSSEVAEVHEEYDEDGATAWDENSRRLFDFIAAANPSVVLALLDEIITLKADLAAAGGREAYDIWIGIGADSRLKRARQKLSLHELRLIVGHVQGRPLPHPLDRPADGPLEGQDGPVSSPGMNSDSVLPSSQGAGT